MNHDLAKASGPDCFPVVVLKNCEPKLSYILVELFNKCLKESCFPDRCKISSVPAFKNVGERSTARNYRRVSLLSVVSKVFEKLVNNRIVDHPEKCGLFSHFQYGLQSHVISGQIFGIISSFLSNRGLPVVLDGKSSQEYAVNAGVPQGAVLGPTLFLLCINDLLILLSMLMMLLSNLTAIRHLLCTKNLNWF